MGPELIKYMMAILMLSMELSLDSRNKINPRKHRTDGITYNMDLITDH